MLPRLSIFPGLAIGVWAFTGLLTVAGALTNSEIASEITDSGGQYVYFRVLFDDGMAFLTGINYVGVRWGTFVSDLFTYIKLATIGVIIFLAFVFGNGTTENFFPLWGTPGSGSLFVSLQSPIRI